MLLGFDMRQNYQTHDCFWQAGKGLGEIDKAGKGVCGCD